jgi:hypothetical protein
MLLFNFLHCGIQVKLDRRSTRLEALAVLAESDDILAQMGASVPDPRPASTVIAAHKANWWSGHSEHGRIGGASTGAHRAGEVRTAVMWPVALAETSSESDPESENDEETAEAPKVIFR